MVNDTIVDTWDNLLSDWTAHENGTEKMKICTSILELRNFMIFASAQFEAYSGAHSSNIGESMKATKVIEKKRGKMLIRLTKQKKQEEKGPTTARSSNDGNTIFYDDTKELQWSKWRKSEEKIVVSRQIGDYT